jgi:hypothetical protein
MRLIQTTLPLLLMLSSGASSAALSVGLLGTAVKAVSAALAGPLGWAVAITSTIAALNAFNAALKKTTQNANEQRDALVQLRALQNQIRNDEQRSQKGVTKSQQKTNIEDIMVDLKNAGQLTGKLKGSLEGLRNIDPNEAIKKTGKYLKAQVEIAGKTRTIITDTLTLRRLEAEGVAKNLRMIKYKTIDLTIQEKTRMQNLERINSHLVDQRAEMKAVMNNAMHFEKVYDQAQRDYEAGHISKKQAMNAQAAAYRGMHTEVTNLQTSGIAWQQKMGNELDGTFSRLGTHQALSLRLTQDGRDAFDNMSEAITTMYQRYNMGLDQSTKNLEEFKGAVSGATSDMVINNTAVKTTKTSVKELNSELKKILNELKKLKDFRIELRIDTENKMKILRGDLTEAGAEAEKLSRKLLDNLDKEIEKTKRVQKLRLRKFQKGGTGGDYRYRPLTDDQQATYNEARNKKLLTQYVDYLATFETLLKESVLKRENITTDFYSEETKKRQAFEFTEFRKAQEAAKEETKNKRDQIQAQYDKQEQTQKAIFELRKKIANDVKGSQQDVANASLEALTSVSQKERDLLKISGEMFDENATQSIHIFENMIATLGTVLQDPKLERFARENPLIDSFTITPKQQQKLMKEYDYTVSQLSDAVLDTENLREFGFHESDNLVSTEQLKQSLDNARELHAEVTKLSVIDVEKIETQHHKDQQTREKKHQAELNNIMFQALETKKLEIQTAARNQAEALRKQELVDETSKFSELLSAEEAYYQQRAERILETSVDNTLANSLEKELILQKDKQFAQQKLDLYKKMYEEMGYIDHQYYAGIAQAYGLDYSKYTEFSMKKNSILTEQSEFEQAVAKDSNKLFFKLFSSQFSAFVSYRRNKLKLEEEYYNKVAHLEKQLADRRKDLQGATTDGEKERLGQIINALKGQKAQAESQFKMAKTAGAKNMIMAFAGRWAAAVKIISDTFKGLVNGIKGIMDFVQNVYSTLKDIVSTFTGGFDIDPMAFLQGGTQAIITNMEEAKKALEELERRYAEGIITAQEYQEALNMGVGTADPERAIVTYLQEAVDDALMFISALEQAIPLLIDKVKQAIPTVLNALKGVLPDVLGFIMEFIPFIGKELMSFIVSLIPSVITTFSNLLPNIITGFVDLLSNNIGSIVNKLKEALINLGIMLFSPLEEGGQSLVEKLLIALTDGLIALLSGAGDLFLLLVPIIDRLIPVLANMLSKVLNVVLKNFSKFQMFFNTFFRAIAVVFVQAIIANLVPLLGAALQQVFLTLPLLLAELLHDVIQAVIMGIGTLIDNFVQDIKDIFSLGLFSGDEEAESYGDTPNAIQAGTSGLLAKFAPGDYVIAAQNPINVASQAMELLSRGTTNAVARGIAPLTSPTSANAQTGSSGYQNVNIKITADGKILDAITVNAMDKGNAPKLKRKIRKASGLKTGFDRGTYNRY